MKRNTNIYSTYPPNGKLPKKGRKNIYNLDYRQLSRTSEYQSTEEGFEAFGEGDDWDESITSEPHSDTGNMLLSPNLYVFVYINKQYLSFTNYHFLKTLQ